MNGKGGADPPSGRSESAAEKDNAKGIEEKRRDRQLPTGSQPYNKMWTMVQAGNEP